MNVHVRGIESLKGREVYITAGPDRAHPSLEQAQDVFEGVRDALRKNGAWICQERIFSPPESVEELAKLRRQIYSDLDDGVAPTWLADAEFRGVQIYAISQRHKPRVLGVDGQACGRLVRNNGCAWVTAGALPVVHVTNTSLSPEEAGRTQTRLAFEQAESILKQAGGDVKSVARTWFYLDHILDWYGVFNDTRSRFFTEHRLLAPGSGGKLPASTGMGVSPAGGARCSMDLIAVVGDPTCARYPEGCALKHLAAGKQRSAYEYKSSFARAATVCTPAGHTVFVSGTAAIDPTGATCHRGDIRGQIRMTLDCVDAVLSDLGCRESDLVQAIAYCKTAEVEEWFEPWRQAVDLPWTVVRGDICRDDLLFEAEAVACRGARAF
jgi:enamine deaminase RidA (YjgF/YER057c/UK114 family)